jgi:hypothetical protein
VTYRDDLDAAQARVTALEQELASTRTRLAEAEDRRSHALVLAEQDVALALAGGGRAARVFGGPLRVRLERTFSGELDPASFEDLIELIRTTTKDAGRSELMKASLLWTSSSPPNGVGPFLTVMVSSKRGQVTMSVEDRFGNTAGIVYGAVGGGIAGGLAVLPIMATVAIPVLGIALIPVWLGGAVLGCRALYRRATRKRTKQAHQLFEQLGDEIARLVKPASG